MKLCELTYPTRERISSLASFFGYRLHVGHRVRKRIVAIDACDFTNGLPLQRLAPPAALAVMQFVEGPAA
jgi:hypothetical protein